MPQLDGAESATEINLVLFEFIAESVRNDGHQVCRLTESGIDLLPRHGNKIVDGAESEAGNSSKLVQCRNVEDFIDEVGLSQFRIALLQRLHLLVYLLLPVELLSQLALVVIDLLPDLLVLLGDFDLLHF